MTDKEIDKKLKKMEEQLDVITSTLERSDSRFLSGANPDSSFSNPDSRFLSHEQRELYGRSDEIDLRELFSILWLGKWWIIGVTFLFAVAGVVYAISLPNMYKSEGIYAPGEREVGSALSGQIGGLAAMAGINIGGEESNDIDRAIALLESWPFIESVVDKHDLKPLVMGVIGWSGESDTLVWDREMFDPVNKQWLREPSHGRKAEPSGYEVYERLKEFLVVSRDSKTNLIQISFTFYNPELAIEWLDLFVRELNEHFRSRDQEVARKSIEYLEKKIAQTAISDMQAVFYEVIEAQTKTLMLTEVNDQYLIETVVSPMRPEKKSRPLRALVVVLFVFIGGALGVVTLITRRVVRRA